MGIMRMAQLDHRHTNRLARLKHWCGTHIGRQAASQPASQEGRWKRTRIRRIRWTGGQGGVSGPCQSAACCDGCWHVHLVEGQGPGEGERAVYHHWQINLVLYLCCGLQQTNILNITEKTHHVQTTYTVYFPSQSDAVSVWNVYFDILNGRI